MKLCSRRACSSRKPDEGNGVGPRKGDSDTSDVDCWLDMYRRRESLLAIGERGVVEDDDPEKSSAREAASR